MLSVMHIARCCNVSGKKIINRVYMISDETKDNEFLSVVNEEQQTYLQRIKELENMVCEFLIVSDIND
jgi:hypothetical protein